MGRVYECIGDALDEIKQLVGSASETKSAAAHSALLPPAIGNLVLLGVSVHYEGALELGGDGSHLFLDKPNNVISFHEGLPPPLRCEIVQSVVQIWGWDCRLPRSEFILRCLQLFHSAETIDLHEKLVSEPKRTNHTRHTFFVFYECFMKFFYIFDLPHNILE
jgi:hypothetical protein